MKHYVVSYKSDGQPAIYGPFSLAKAKKRAEMLAHTYRTDITVCKLQPEWVLDKPEPKWRKP